jgi:hypothetical protein
MQTNGPKLVQIVELKQYSFQEHKEHYLRKPSHCLETQPLLGLKNWHFRPLNTLLLVLTNHITITKHV